MGSTSPGRFMSAYFGNEGVQRWPWVASHPLNVSTLLDFLSLSLCHRSGMPETMMENTCLSVCLVFKFWSSSSFHLFLFFSLLLCPFSFLVWNPRQIERLVLHFHSLLHVFVFLLLTFCSSSWLLLDFCSKLFKEESPLPILPFPSPVLPVKTSCQRRNLRPFWPKYSKKLPCFLNADSLHWNAILSLPSLLLSCSFFFLFLCPPSIRDSGCCLG